MKTYQEFFDHLTSTYLPVSKNDRTNTYGYIWETKVGAWFLKNDHQWKTQFKHETIMSPQKWGYGIESSKTRKVMWKDLGIDLVAEDHDGNMWGIQAKCYTVDIPSTEIDKFLGAMGATFFNFNNPKITKTFFRHFLRSQTPSAASSFMFTTL